jgi:hypothetical protein
MSKKLFRLALWLFSILCASLELTLASKAEDSGLYQLHVDGKLWSYDGSSKCPDDPQAYCPGWALIDRNPATKFVASSAGQGLYQLHGTGWIYKATGPLNCPDDPNAYCTGWTAIDRNQYTKSIAISTSGLFQLHTDGSIWLYDGKSKCPDDAKAYCPGWTLIDRINDNINPAVEIIAIGTSIGYEAYQRRQDGSIYAYSRRGCPDPGICRCPDDNNAQCPGWKLIDRNMATAHITAWASAVQIHSDNRSLWVWRGLAEDGCPKDKTHFCTGWAMIDRNPRTESTIEASPDLLYQRHVDGRLWKFDNRSVCPTDINIPCPGWTLIDRNTNTKDIVVSPFHLTNSTLYQIQTDGKIYKYDGTSKCPDDEKAYCLGWTLIDRNSRAKAIFGTQGYN